MLYSSETGSKPVQVCSQDFWAHELVGTEKNHYNCHNIISGQHKTQKHFEKTSNIFYTTRFNHTITFLKVN